MVTNMTNQKYKLPVIWANTHWILDSRRVLIQPEDKLLILSDIHIGYYSSLRAQGGYLPAYDAQLLTKTVESLLEDYPKYHWIIAGDIKHNLKSSISREEYTELKDLLERIANQNRLTIIIGNHDTGLRSILQKIAITCTITDSFSYHNISVIHKQVLSTQSSSLNYIIGHFHPVISIEYLKGLFIPVFAVSKDVLILPAFNTVAGGYNIKNLYIEDEGKKEFLIYAIGQQIYDLGPLRHLIN